MFTFSVLFCALVCVCGWCHQITVYPTKIQMWLLLAMVVIILLIIIIVPIAMHAKNNSD